MSRPWLTFIVVVVASYILLTPVVLIIAGNSWRGQTHLTMSNLYMPCCIVMALAASYYHHYQSRVGTIVCLTLLIVGVGLAAAIRPGW